VKQTCKTFYLLVFQLVPKAM